MVRGRKPLPTATKEASGTFKHNPQRRNVHEPKPIAGIPPIPEAIADDPIASKCWTTICGTLNEMGILTLSDASVMELYCVTYSQWRTMAKAVANGNCTSVAPSGNVTTSPEALQVHKYAATLLKLMTELGLTPSSRSRIHAIPPEEEEDPFKAILTRMGQG